MFLRKIRLYSQNIFRRKKKTRPPLFNDFLKTKTQVELLGDYILYCFALVLFCLFVLRFYGPVNPMGSCRARSVYITTLLLGRLSPLSG